jgi:hypothetical protein
MIHKSFCVIWAVQSAQWPRHCAIRIKLGDEVHEFQVVQTVPK